MERYIATIAQSTEVVRAAVDSVNLEADSESKIVLVPQAPSIGCGSRPEANRHHLICVRAEVSVPLEAKVIIDDCQSEDPAHSIRELLCKSLNCT
jgi:hypothetical protein